MEYIQKQIIASMLWNVLRHAFTFDVQIVKCLFFIDPSLRYILKYYISKASFPLIDLAVNNSNIFKIQPKKRSNEIDVNNIYNIVFNLWQHRKSYIGC